MDYRIRQGVQMSWTSKEDGDGSAYHYDYNSASLPSSSAFSIAAKAIRESSPFHDSSLSAAYGLYYSSCASRDNRHDSTTYEYTSLKILNESKQGLWGLLARKAKAILDDDSVAQVHKTHAAGKRKYQMPREAIGGQYHTSSSLENRQKSDSPTLQKEGFTMVKNPTVDIIQETRRLQRRRKGGSELQNQPPLMQNHLQPQIQTDLETQLKASRDVVMAMGMAAKAKSFFGS